MCSQFFFYQEGLYRRNWPVLGCSSILWTVDGLPLWFWFAGDRYEDPDLRERGRSEAPGSKVGTEVGAEEKAVHPIDNGRAELVLCWSLVVARCAASVETAID